MMSLPVWLTGPMFLLGRGVSVPGPIIPSGGLCAGWSLSREGLCPGGSLSSRGSLSRGFCTVGSLSRRFLSKGVSVWGSLSR